MNLTWILLLWTPVGGVILFLFYSVTTVDKQYYRQAHLQLYCVVGSDALRHYHSRVTTAWQAGGWHNKDDNSHHCMPETVTSPPLVLLQAQQVGSLLVPSVPRRLSDSLMFIQNAKGGDGFHLKLTTPNMIEMSGSQVSVILKVNVAQSCLTLCDPMGYIVHGILQARILEWVAFPFSRGYSQPRAQTQVSLIEGGFFTSWAIREAQAYWSG